MGRLLRTFPTLVERSEAARRLLRSCMICAEALLENRAGLAELFFGFNVAPQLHKTSPEVAPGIAHQPVSVVEHSPEHGHGLEIAVVVEASLPTSMT